MLPSIFVAATLAAGAPALVQPCGLFTLRADSVAPGVYVAHQPEPFPSMFYLEGNSTVIVNDADVVVVDAGASPAVGECLVTLVRRLTPKPVRVLVDTHWHGDHTFGNEAFARAYPGLEIIGSTLTRAGLLGDGAKSMADLARSTESRKKLGRELIADAESHRDAGTDSVVRALRQYYEHDLDGRQRDYRNVHITPPTRLVDSSLTLTRGGRVIRIFSIGKGDAPGTLVVWLPNERVLVAADLVVRPVPFGYTAEPIAWRRTLARIDSLPWTVLVPGHGDPQHDRAYLHELMGLIDTVTATTRKGIEAGLSADTVRARMDARRLGTPFTRGSPVLQFFFEMYFLNPFVTGVGEEIARQRAEHPGGGAQDTIDLTAAPREWRVVNRHVTVVDSGGRTFLRFDEAAGVGMAWIPKIDFTDGEIELDVRGRSTFQKSFVGIAFRAVSDTAWDAVYLRPFNFSAADSTRHAHAIQYIGAPSFPWERLRADQPGMYEKPVTPAPNADSWVHLRFVMRGPDLQVFVNRATTPALHVETLTGLTHGAIALWVGDLSTGDFANIVVR